MPLRRLLFPGVLLAAGLAVYFFSPESGPESLPDWLPYALLAMVLALSGYNGHARTFAAGLALLIVYYIVVQKLQVSLAESGTLRIYSLVSVIFPVMMLYLLFMPARGLWNRYGLMVVAIVPVLLFAGVAVFCTGGRAAGFY